MEESPIITHERLAAMQVAMEVAGGGDSSVYSCIRLPSLAVSPRSGSNKVCI